MKSQIGQHFFIGLSSLSLSAEEKKFIVDNNVGGVLLKAQNLSEPKQVHSLCQEIQSLRHQTVDQAPLFIAVELDSGKASPLREPFTQWPSLEKLIKLDAPTLSFHYANEIGKELFATGINLNLAPCVDVLNGDAEMIAKHASALIRGYMKAEVLTCAKHFPGRRNAHANPEALQTQDLDLAQLQACELIPFKKSFKSRVDMVLVASILFPKIDSQWPANLSEIFLKKMIREEFRYRGLILGEGLDHASLLEKYQPAQVPARAINAGCDMLFYTNYLSAAQSAIENISRAISSGEISKDELEKSRQRIFETKKNKIAHADPLSFAEAEKVIGHSLHRELAEAISQGQMPSRVLTPSE